MSGPASGPLPPPAWGLSPLRDEAPPATPGALYRSCFASECEALLLQLGRKDLALPTPGRGALTVEAETLTPLEPSWSFLAESPLGPPQQQQPPAPPGPAPPSASNRTYDKAPSLCEASLEGPTPSRLQDAEDDRRLTFEKLPGEASLSFVASTPLPPREGFFQRTPEKQDSSLPKAPLRDRACLRPPRGLSRKKSLASATGGRVAAGATSSAPGVRGAHGKRAGAVDACLASTARRESSGAANGPKLPEGRNSLLKLPSNKKSRPPSRPSRGPELLNGLATPIVGREPKPSGSKLPVRSATRGDKATRKRPLERRLVKGATTPQQQSASSRFRPGKRHTEKPACGVLLDTGQIPSATLLSRPTAPCPQCQLLAEENRRLKSMLENCERRIAGLPQKKPDEEFCGDDFRETK